MGHKIATTGGRDLCLMGQTRRVHVSASLQLGSVSLKRCCCADHQSPMTLIVVQISEPSLNTLNKLPSVHVAQSWQLEQLDSRVYNAHMPSYKWAAFHSCHNSNAYWPLAKCVRGGGTSAEQWRLFCFPEFKSNMAPHDMCTNMFWFTKLFWRVGYYRDVIEMAATLKQV